jgi:hypothetical protein
MPRYKLRTLLILLAILPPLLAGVWWLSWSRPIFAAWLFSCMVSSLLLAVSIWRELSTPNCP